MGVEARPRPVPWVYPLPLFPSLPPTLSPQSKKGQPGGLLQMAGMPASQASKPGFREARFMVGLGRADGEERGLRGEAPQQPLLSAVPGGPGEGPHLGRPHQEPG